MTSDKMKRKMSNAQEGPVVSVPNFKGMLLERVKNVEKLAVREGRGCTAEEGGRKIPCCTPAGKSPVPNQHSKSCHIIKS